MPCSTPDNSYLFILILSYLHKAGRMTVLLTCGMAVAFNESVETS
jgi:hypothetical protein